MPDAPNRWANPRRLATATLYAVIGLTAVACNLTATPATRPGVIAAVGAENQYADVLAQIGGKYVQVSSVLNNPSTDPHTFESSPSVAEEVSSAQMIVQNGVGYDSFMNKVESASPNSARKVIVVQQLLGLPDSTANPHLWYDPKTMLVVATAMANALAALQPTHSAYFRANLRRFDSSLTPWLDAIAAFKAQYAGVAAATTEPVADYLLQAMGIDVLTAWRLQADIMNGVDPAPQDIALEQGLLDDHKVKVFLYNEQVGDALTNSFRGEAHRDGIPVVGVYETMPTPGYDYQSWMVAEVRSILQAVANGKSTEHL